MAAFSKKDFTHKMNIAQKEARETKYWLKLLSETNIVTSNSEKLLAEIEEIIRILTAIVKSSQTNINN
jgi:four helix bundle protein